MPKFRLTMRQTMLYTTEVEAESFEEAMEFGWQSWEFDPQGAWPVEGHNDETFISVATNIDTNEERLFDI